MTSPEGPRPPFEQLREHLMAVLSFQDLNGHRSTWQLIREDVARLDGQTLVGCASHWNALLQDLGGGSEIAAQVPVVRYLASPEQLRDINAAVQRRAAQEGLPAGTAPPVVTRQGLLILMRLAFQDARWDTGGAPVDGRKVLDLLLRINDHLDGLPDLPPKLRRRSRSQGLADKYRAFPLMFSLHDFSHSGIVESGVTRTLRMLREIHPELSARDEFKKTALDLPDLFVAGTGLSIETYLTFCFAALSLTTAPGRPGSPHPGTATPNDTGVFNIAPSNLRGDSTLTDAESEHFLSTLALPPEQFRALLSHPLQQPQQTNFTVFRGYPLVHFPGGAYRVLDKGFLLDKLVNGAYWVARGALERRERSGRDAVKRFNGWWGRLFEEYLHRIFLASTEPGRYEPEPRFETSPDAAGDCDALLTCGEEVVLFEYKSSPLAVKPRHSTSPRALAGEILKKFAGEAGTGSGSRRGARGTPQLANSIREFLGGRPLGEVQPSAVAAVYPVIVCADSGMGAPMVNCLLRRRFERQLIGGDMTKLRPLTVLTVESVERMLGREPEVPFTAMLRAWHERDPLTP